MSWKPEVDEIKQRRELALAQGGADAVAKQHSQNRLTIRERVDQLLDEGSFEELGPVGQGQLGIGVVSRMALQRRIASFSGGSVRFWRGGRIGSAEVRRVPGDPLGLGNSLWLARLIR